MPSLWFFVMAVPANNSDKYYGKIKQWYDKVWLMKRRFSRRLISKVRRDICEEMTFWCEQIAPKSKVATFLAEKTDCKSPKEHKWGLPVWKGEKMGEQSEMILERSDLNLISWYLESIKHQENMPRPGQHRFIPFLLLEFIQINLLNCQNQERGKT